VKRSWHLPAQIAGGLAVAASVLVVPGPSPSASVAAFVPPGPVAVAHYDLGDTAFTDPHSGTVSELRAVVHHPRDLRRGTPLIVLSHGSWYACDDPEAQTWPCPAGSRPYPSYRGYDYLGAALAARGFVAVSLSAGGINMTSFDYGDRARLINRHLQMWQQLADTGGGPLAGRFTDAGTGRRVDPPFRGHVDPRNVGTLGHSRAGKGVMWQASDKHRAEWPARVRVRAVVPLAPVKFDHPEGDNSDTLGTRIPFAAVVGGCDGAVGRAGLEYLDDVEGRNTTPVYGLVLPTANHNYFNTAWTPPAPLGEDDSTCPGRELTPEQQRGAAETYLVAFYSRHLKGDRRYDAVLDGTRPLPGVPSRAISVPVPPGG
jgi:hypothetical protein